MLHNRKIRRKQEALKNVLLEIKYTDNIDEDGLKLISNLVKSIRPNVVNKVQFAEEQIDFLIKCLQSDEDVLIKIRQLFYYLFISSDISEVMTDSGLIAETGFFSEVYRRLKDKVLPPLKNPGSFIYAIDSIFYKSSDYLWVTGVDNKKWVHLFQLFGVQINISNESLRAQLLNSLNILSYRIAILGMEKTIVERSGKTSGGISSPFVGQNRVLNDFRIPLTNNDLEKSQEFKTRYLAVLDQCDEILALLKRKSVVQGIGIRQTYAMLQLRQILERIRLIIDFTDQDEEDMDINRFVVLFKVVVENENTKDSIRKCIGENIQLLAYQIAEHEQNTGEHYITSTRKEYIEMLKSSGGGGVIVSFFAVFKLLLHHLSMAPFWQAFSYSINYAAGFILIQVTGCTLATKQPAMTASSLASSLDGKKFGGPDLPQLAITVSRVMRSQTASFAGNLMVAFPVALVIAMLWNLVFGYPMAGGEHAQELLDQINPLRSASYWYAAIAGVFLFLSGLISGYVDNSVRYGKIPQRIREHPFLRLTFSQDRINRIADFIDRKWGLIMGNLMFGIFMGTAPFIGYMFGLPIDIRHITFSTANFAIALWGLEFHIPFAELMCVLFGIALIGFINFAVSFALAFYVAVKSRGIRVRQYGRIFYYLKVLLKKYPLDFIRPPKRLKTPEDIL